MDDDGKLPAHQGGVAGVGGKAIVPQAPAKPITDEVLDSGQRASRDKHERHKRHERHNKPTTTGKQTITATVEVERSEPKTMLIRLSPNRGVTCR